MRLRIYIEATDSEKEKTVAAIDAHLATLGEISERQSVPYWKVPVFTEVLRVFSPRLEPSQIFADTMRFLGTGWTHDDETAHLTKVNAAEFTFPGIRDIFLDIEPLDWGRDSGVIPRFTFEDVVTIAVGKGDLSDHAGKTATIKGHSFDRHNTKTWSYAIEIEGEPYLHSADESALKPKR